MNRKTAGRQPHRSSYKLRLALGRSSALPCLCRNNIITKSLDDYSIYTKVYSHPEELNEWIPRIKQLASGVTKIYISFNNHYQGKAVKNARQMRDLITK